MNYSFGDILALFQTPIGRKRLVINTYQTAWPFLSRMASLYRQTFVRKMRIVAVIGSLGKTTTTRAVVTALGRNVYHSSKGQWGSALARTVLNIRPHDRHAVIEVPINSIGQMASFARIVRPDITVVTSVSIGSEHYRSLSSTDAIRIEKSEMVKILPKTGVAVLNGDDPNVLWMRGQTRSRVITFGIGESNDIRASDIIHDWPTGTRFRLHADGQIHNLNIKLVGRHMVYPILAAVAVALTEGFALDQILPALEALTPTPGRLQPIRLLNGAFLLRDDFKSPLDTINVALDLLSEIPARRKIVVFGDVEEPPGSAGPIYGHIGERVGKIASRAIFICGNRSFQGYRSGAKTGGLPKSELINAGRSILKPIEILRDDLKSGDVVLIKGRCNQRLARIALALAGRTVRCNISFCKTGISCEHCPMLERGWDGLKVVM